MRMAIYHLSDETYAFAIREAQSKLPADASDEEVAALASKILHFYTGLLASPSGSVH